MTVFDARAAKLLAAGEHLTLDDAPGLRLVATASAKAWIYRYKSPVDGLMKQIKIGSWPAMALGVAMGDWAALKASRDAGRCPATEKKAARVETAVAATAAKRAQKVEALTVSRLCDDFAELFAKPRRQAKGYAELKRLFATMLPADIAALPAAEVSRGVAYELINSHAERPVVAISLRQELGAAWDWAMDSGRLSQDTPNWWRVILRGKLKSRGKVIGGKRQGVKKTVLRPDEVGAVLRFLPHVSRLPAELLTMYLWTGCRGAEICAMEAGEVGQEGDEWWWTIPKHKTKNARHDLAVDLRVPLIGRALEIVRSRLDVYPEGYLFRSVNKNAALGHVQQKVVGVAVFWHRVGCEVRPEQERPRWPVPHFAPHDLRRTVRTQLAALGCPADVAEAVLGHMQPGVEGVYNRHTYDKERLYWLTLLDESWEAAAAR